MIRRLTALVFAISVITFPVGVGSWQVIAHYQLGVDAGVDPTRSYQMLPDSWPSHEPLWKLLQITEWFAWSHAVVLTGTTSMVPNVPALSKDRRDPGQDMYDIYMNSSHPTTEAYETALGFLTHNAQDKAVHYDYFRGGSRAALKEEHQDMEIWADCWIFEQKIGTFDQDGNPQGLPDIRNVGQAELIESAEQAFRRTGNSLARHEKVYLPKESAAEIRQRLQDTERMSKQYLANFSERLCIEKYRWAVNYNWTLDKLEEYYGKAYEATRRTRDKFPPKQLPSTQAPKICPSRNDKVKPVPTFGAKKPDDRFD